MRHEFTRERSPGGYNLCVKRYQGEPLPPSARIALLANDALGNYVVATPLIAMLKAKFPGAHLTFLSGGRTAEFWRNDPRLDASHLIYGTDLREAAEFVVRQSFDWVINLETSTWAMAMAALACGEDTFVTGPCLNSDGRSPLPSGDNERGRLLDDREWISEDLTTRYPFLESGFIGEIFCRLAWMEGPICRYHVPSQPVDASTIPDVLIATSASLPEKLWPVEKWEAALDAMRAQGRTVGLLGAKPAAQSKFWRGNETEARLVESGRVQDLRGQFTLPQVVGALAAARYVFTLDNGILHLAAATETPTVGLFRHGIHRLWAPPAPNVTVVTPGEGRMVADIPVAEAVGAMGLGG